MKEKLKKQEAFLKADVPCICPLCFPETSTHFSVQCHECRDFSISRKIINEKGQTTYKCIVCL